MLPVVIVVNEARCRASFASICLPPNRQSNFIMRNVKYEMIRSAQLKLLEQELKILETQYQYCLAVQSCAFASLTCKLGEIFQTCFCLCSAIVLKHQQSQMLSFENPRPWDFVVGGALQECCLCCADFWEM